MNDSHISLQVLLAEKAKRDAEKQRIKNIILQHFELCDYTTVKWKKGPDGAPGWRVKPQVVYQYFGVTGVGAWDKQVRNVLLEMGVIPYRTPEFKIGMFAGIRPKRKPTTE